MDDNDKTRFAQLITGLAEDCSAKVSNHGLKMKFEAMKAHSIEEIEAAIITVMKTNIYTKMPTTGTILNAIIGTIDDRAERQYTFVLRAIREIGSYGSPKFKDKVTHSIVHERFGWRKICMLQNSEMGFFERDFKQAYTIQSKPSYDQMQIGRDEQPRQIADIIKSISNSLSGEN